jgi:hypothetical protein
MMKIKDYRRERRKERRRKEKDKPTKLEERQRKNDDTYYLPTAPSLAPSLSFHKICKRAMPREQCLEI